MFRRKPPNHVRRYLTRLPMQFINFGLPILLSLLHQQKPVQSRLLPNRFQSNFF
jgi:hypothetical protein